MSVEIKSHYLYLPEYKEKLQLEGEVIYAKEDYEISRDRPTRFERYGGWGSDGHGGGGRSAVLGDVQIKGCGVTPLAGKVDNVNYTHGKLTLADGAYEILYSSVLDKVLPMGTAECLALLYTGEESAFEYSREGEDLKPTHGALLVRRNIQRPANFLPVRSYKVNEEFIKVIGSDTDRLRRINRELGDKFKSRSAFIQYLGIFLANSANQFAFARVAGIFHGGLSHSNLSSNGQWLDLSTATFVDKGRNYICEHISFYQEPELILEVLNEWVATYAKYQKASLDITPLANYYNEQLQAYQDYHSAYILGLDRKALSNSELSIELKPIYGDLLSLLFPASRNHTIEELRPKAENKLVDYLIKFYCNAKQSSQEEKKGESEFFERIYNHCNNDDGISSVSFKKRSAIKSLKRAILPGAFFYVLVKRSIRKSIKDDPLSVGDLIKNYESLADWVFDDEFKDKEVLFQSPLISIFYNLCTNKIEVISSGVEELELFDNLYDVNDSFAHDLIDPVLLNYYWCSLKKVFKGISYENG
ncbi:hypothetical protein EYS14_09285 [Alteromonadaceae bacterium M269]|nr:hypothetical protein EYS14_09285 [Alteromonadaceae bacterium M269]